MNKKIKNTILGLRIYNGCMSFLYFLVFVLICPITIFAISDRETPIWFSVFCLGFILLICLGLLVAYIIGTLKASAQSKKVWVLQIVLVAIGLSSLLTIIPSIFLLIYLIDDEVQRYYKKGNK